MELEEMNATKQAKGCMNFDKHRLKILYLIEYLHGFGGTERHMFQLATRLNPAQFDCTVCAMNYHSEIVDVFSDSGINVIPMHFTRIYSPDGIRQIFQLSRILKEGQFDVIQTFNVDADIVGIIAGRLAKVPIIISSRRDMGGYRKAHHLAVTRILNRYVTKFIAVCNAACDQIVRMEGITPHRIKTIYNGFDQTSFAPVNSQTVAKIRQDLEIHAEDFLLGYVAHFRPEKGHDVLLKAFAILARTIPRLKLLLIGAGSTLPVIQESARSQGLSDRVVFTDYVTNIIDHMSILDICCFTPVSNEGFSNALLEQMSMGKPIIATDVGGNSEIIEHDVSGLMLPPNDPQAIADAILRLFYNPEMRRLFGEKARASVEEKFALDKMLAQTESLYCDLYQELEGAKTARIEVPL